jgi:transcriptional antiterminator NusG
MAKKWYGVHTYSGFENKVRLSLHERIKNMGLEDCFGEILIPSETVVELKKGEKTSSRNSFRVTSYNMELNDEIWHMSKRHRKLQDL